MIRILCCLVVVSTMLSTRLSTVNAATVIDFESHPLGVEDFFQGPVPGADESPGPYGGTRFTGNLDIQGVGFSNSYENFYNSWGGFAVSNRTDTTTGDFNNQFSAFPGSGANESSNYGVASGYHDLVGNFTGNEAFDRNNLAHLRGLPSIYLPQDTEAISAFVTNTTYAALTMANGGEGARAFGDTDFFKLSVYGIDANDEVLSNEIEFHLADYRSEDDYIIDAWTLLDLTPLAGASSLHFNLASNDNGNWGMNTPSYFAIDNLTIQAVPEPSSFAILSLGGTAVWFFRRRR
ncbi:hypothetical protein Q31b_24460 [Novipirellula aureliae]|uniref:Ice-binding protein C-terminal domain-containing protein n=1 Tax=Novipirellula aureliae TaxID=2527966 RepID=A0A5C6E626_9BACT|nr:DUF4465 domain-containing protein [Novipirellula aureliae]TWU43407.1 hypothetical protein Q31b_24460 [Novipirellula aureliae]